MAEVTIRFSPPDPHPSSYDTLRTALLTLATAEGADVEGEALRWLWLLVSSLGFAPELDECVRDGSLVARTGDLPFSTREGGALCAACAREFGATRLPLSARHELSAFLDPDAVPPPLDGRTAKAHRRLVARFVRYHLGDGVELPALEFWERRPWLAG
jgi:recombinational DNA repair protein (RecF pathway)